MNKTRKITAIIISPFITAYMFTIFFMDAIGGDGGWGGGIMLLILSIPVFYIGAIFIGYPSISYLKKKDKLTILWLSLTGFIIGLVTINLGLIMFYITSLWNPQTVRIINRFSFSETLMVILVAGTSSAFGAFIFSIISGVTKTKKSSLTNQSSSPTKSVGCD